MAVIYLQFYIVLVWQFLYWKLIFCLILLSFVGLLDFRFGFLGVLKYTRVFQNLCRIRFGFGSLLYLFISEYIVCVGQYFRFSGCRGSQIDEGLFGVCGWFNLRFRMCTQEFGVYVIGCDQVQQGFVWVFRYQVGFLLGLERIKKKGLVFKQNRGLQIVVSFRKEQGYVERVIYIGSQLGLE